MKLRLDRLTATRIASVLALLAAILIPWYGWIAAGAVAALVLAGALLAPHPHLPHRGRVRMIFEALRRRVVRSPWRMKRFR